MPTLKHTHTARKVKGTRGDSLTFICNDPKCTWKQPAAFIEGKQFKCPYCNQPYLLTRSLMQLRLPHCKACTRGHNNEKPLEEKILEELPVMNKLEQFLELGDKEEKFDE